MDDDGRGCRSVRYNRIRLLGSGGFASVYLALDQELNRKVAIKIFGGSHSDSSLERFKREALICRKLRHPNIIKIYDAFLDGKEPSIVMEYVKAGDLVALMNSRALTRQEVFLICRQVAEALAYLHENNIFHRDIKPPNIMIEEPFKAVLMDFNLALSNEFSTLTKEGFVLGTPRYMAPELFLGERATAPSEVYSLGLLLYDMLSGGRISKIYARPEKMLGEVLKKLSAFDLEVSPEIKRFIAWTTAWEAEDRCPSMGAFLKVLSMIEEGKTPAESDWVKAGNSIGHGDDGKEGTAQKRGAKRAAAKPGAPKTGAAKGLPKDDSECHSSGAYPDVVSKNSRIDKGGARRVLMLCLFLLVMVPALYFSINPLGRTSNTAPALSSGGRDPKVLLAANATIFNLAMKCDEANLQYLNILNFSKEEERLFEATAGGAKIEYHCSLLRLLTERVKKDTVFSSFLNYRYRLRKSNPQGSDDSINESVISLLDNTINLHWARLSSKSVVPDKVSVQDLSLAHFLFNLRWEHEWQRKEVALKKLFKSMNDFQTLDGKVRHSQEGRAFFHSMALCHLFLNNDALIEDPSFLFTRPPYDYSLLKDIRLSLIGKSPFMSENFMKFFKYDGDTGVEQYGIQSKSAYKQLSRIHRTLTKKNKFFTSEVQENRFTVLTSRSHERNDFEDSYEEHLKKYKRVMITSFYLLTLGPPNPDFAQLVQEKVSKTIKLALRSSPDGILTRYNSGTTEDHGPFDFVSTILGYWRTTALDYLGSNNLVHQGYVLCTFRDLRYFTTIVSDKARINAIATFDDVVSQIDAPTGLALKIINGRYERCAPPALADVRQAYHSLSGLMMFENEGDFHGWSILMAVVSNELLLRLKSEGKNKERAALSLELIKQFADLNDRERDSKPPRYVKQFKGPQVLLRTSIVHACDAYLVNGRNFLDDEPLLSKKMRIKFILKEAASETLMNEIQGGTVAAQKLLLNRPLDLQDILANPLDY